jgi:hypothetical protein
MGLNIGSCRFLDDHAVDDANQAEVFACTDAEQALAQPWQSYRTMPAALHNDIVTSLCLHLLQQVGYNTLETRRVMLCRAVPWSYAMLRFSGADMCWQYPLFQTLPTSDQMILCAALSPVTAAPGTKLSHKGTYRNTSGNNHTCVLSIPLAQPEMCRRHRSKHVPTSCGICPGSRQRDCLAATRGLLWRGIIYIASAYCIPFTAHCVLSLHVACDYALPACFPSFCSSGSNSVLFLHMACAYVLPTCFASFGNLKSVVGWVDI